MLDGPGKNQTNMCTDGKVVQSCMGNNFISNEAQISHFVGSIHGEMQGMEKSPTQQRDGLEGQQQMAMVSGVSANNEMRKCTEKQIIEAEKFRANIATPPTGNMTGLNEQVANMMVNCQSQDLFLGMNNPAVLNNFEQGPHLTQNVSNQPIPNIRAGVSDDNFFHLTCHIEPSLIHKIERGEFVELEKLLPRERSSFSKGGADENRLEWVQRDGNTYLVSAGKDTKITGIRRWEQAFRAYATIYCAVNPQRSKEIWQYIAVINTAASAYIWDNVYNYDITFRHLMAFNPNRSWAVTYNQMWNLSMKDPLPRNQSYRNNHFQFHNSGFNKGSHQSSSNGGANNNHGAGGQRKKSDCCWNFNKGVPCKFGKKCKFIERCRYCDLPAHGIHVCPKLEQKKSWMEV